MANINTSNRSSQLPSVLTTYLAWSFTGVLPGSFKRNKKQFAHLDYPILAPLPTLKTKTLPIEDCGTTGPFIYFVLDSKRRVCYVGKSKEANVIKRWVRPGIGGPVSHYWTHSITSGGSVFNIAELLRSEEGPVSLRYAPISALLPMYKAKLDICQGMDDDALLDRLESHLIGELSPAWNR